MKNSLIVAAAAALLTACSPVVYGVHLDVRQPSPSGLKLAGKSMAVAYMDGPSKVDSLLSAGASAFFAEALEKDYFGGESVIGMYAFPAADTVALESMRSLVMDTGEDVVFLLKSTIDTPEGGKNNPYPKATHPDSSYIYAPKVPIHVQMYVYDSMGKDIVNTYQGSMSVNAAAFNSGIIPQESLDDLVKSKVPGIAAKTVGQRMSKHFMSEWATQTFSFYWFDDLNSYEWLNAIEMVERGQFTDAIKKWEPMVKVRNKFKAAHACYNIAMAFYLLGDMSIATRWLDEADKMENVSLSSNLRKRIAKSLEK